MIQKNEPDIAFQIRLSQRFLILLKSLGLAWILGIPIAIALIHKIPSLDFKQPTPAEVKS